MNPRATHCGAAALHLLLAVALAVTVGACDDGADPDPDLLDAVSDGDGDQDDATSCAACAGTGQCCDGVCVDLETDRDHCGACDRRCMAGACADGLCVCGELRCALGDVCCGGGTRCADLDSDPANCGACGNVCEDTETCFAGRCGCPGPDGVLEQCMGGQVCCPGGGCRDLDVDPTSCGACGVTCGDGERCVGGTCTCGELVAATGAACAPGQACCGSPGTCLDAEDPACVCGSQRCGAGEACCPTDDGAGESCASTWREFANCGACGVVCGAGERCQSGTCICSPGRSECDGDPSNGCEVFLGADSANCGACGAACPAGTVCDGASACSLECQSGLTDCDGECVNLDWNRAHCGACGNACAPGEVADGSGQCAATCQPGLTACDGQCVDLDRNRSYCGTCTTACGPGQVCNGGGACALGCLPGRNVCAGECVDFGLDPRHCGSCGNACPPGRVCDGNGQCAIACAPGRSVCDGQCIDFANDRFHCGGCDQRCAPGASCTDGGCVCGGGLIGCAGACVDPGSRDHCGGCSPCAASEACADGTCVSICPSGTLECSGACVDPTRDAAHCGGCGAACAVGELCLDGACCTPGVSCPGSTSSEGWTELWAGYWVVCGRYRTATGADPLYCWGNGRDLGLLGGAPFAGFATAPIPSPAFPGTSPETTVVAMGMGRDLVCAATSTALYCWGDNTFGQVGDGSTTARKIPVEIGRWGSILDVFDAPVTSLGLAENHACAVTAGGRVYCWGQLPQGPTSLVPVEVPVASGFTALAVGAGQTTTCAHGLTANGDAEVWCWGNAGPQLGCNDTSNPTQCPASATPQPVQTASGTLRGVVRMDLNATHACALVTSGELVCWGRGQAGELGDCPDLATLCASRNSAAAVPPAAVDPSGAIDLRVGHGYTDYQRTCAVLGDGRVACWGTGSYGELGRGCTPEDIGNPCASFAERGIPGAVAGTTGDLRDAVRVVTANRATCALLGDRSIACWGDNSEGLLGLGRGGNPGSGPIGGPSDLGAVATEFQFGCARSASAGLLCWGGTQGSPEPSPVPGLDTNVVDFAVSGDRVVAVDAAGAVVRWSPSDPTLTPPWTPGFDGSVRRAIAADAHAAGPWACALIDDGSVWCQGAVPSGTLGDAAGSTAASDPVVVEGVDGVTASAAAVRVGRGHGCVRLTDDSVRCWGNGTSGQVGDGALALTPQPVALAALDGASPSTAATSLATDDERTCATTQDGRLLCWGWNGDSLLAPSGADVATPTEMPGFGPGGALATRAIMGRDEICALTSGGGLWCWGENRFGALDGGIGRVATPIAVVDGTSAVAIDAALGSDSLLVVFDDGTTLARGANVNAQLGIEAGARTPYPRRVVDPL